MVDGNTVIVDRSPQAADPRMENTSNSRSPQTQKCDIQEINKDIYRSHKMYHIENCGTVYIDSFNARGVRVENCGNNTPKVTCAFVSFPPHCSSHLTWQYHIIQITVLGLLAMRKIYIHNLMQPTMVCGHLRHLPLNILNMYFHL